MADYTSPERQSALLGRLADSGGKPVRVDTYGPDLALLDQLVAEGYAPSRAEAYRRAMREAFARRQAGSCALAPKSLRPRLLAVQFIQYFGKGFESATTAELDTETGEVTGITVHRDTRVQSESVAYESFSAYVKQQPDGRYRIAKTKAAELRRYLARKEAAGMPVPDEVEQAGWFDVDAYRTQASYEGPDAAEETLDGFLTLQAAIDYANSSAFDDFYEVTVVALGEHRDYDPGERVYWRFNRPI